MNHSLLNGTIQSKAVHALGHLNSYLSFVFVAKFHCVRTDMITTILGLHDFTKGHFDKVILQTIFTMIYIRKM